MKDTIEKMLEIDKIKENKLYFIMKVILAFMFATSIFLNSILVFTGDVSDKIHENYFSDISIKNILVYIISWFTAFIFITLIQIIVSKIKDTIYTDKERKTNSKKIFFIILLILLICWLPYILSYFPGGLYSDTARSINQAVGKEPYNNHHPILYALIIKIFIDIAKIILNGHIQIEQIQLGIELFTIFQVVIMASAISYFVCWLYKKKISTKYIVIITLFFCFCRLVPLYAISLWKDTPFCIALFLYIIFIAEIICEKSKNLEEPKKIYIYMFLVLMVAFLRNNGIYIVTVMTITLILVYKSNKSINFRRFKQATIIEIICIIILQGPGYTYFKINTEAVENFGIPMQQLCYVVAKDGKLTEEQTKFINQLCPTAVIKTRYAPCFVDNIKWNKYFNNDFLERHKGEFLKIWFEVFLKNPISYIKSYFLSTIGFWNVNKATLNDAYVNPQMWENSDEYIGIKQSDYIQKTTGVSIRNILNPTFAVSPTIYLFIILLSALITIYKKRYKNLIIYLPSIIVWLTLMLATPVAFSFRYMYILFLMVPFSLIIPFIKSDNEIS